MKNCLSQTVNLSAFLPSEVLHMYKPLRPGQICGEPWLSRVLLKLYELDQYDDAELVRKKTAAMFAGVITRLDPEANMMGEGVANEQGMALAGLEPGTHAVTGTR
ncbi:phage portal protein, lambda family [Holospora obtusa F1]|uniref:Phage portal protein, lambda family n=1 Tax=Holospora obtusa F1 TaxID=1399147 RepID=W6TE48_HOLOB|nr:phage portal protein, lambda family [Holospora obtusa F1]